MRSCACCGDKITDKNTYGYCSRTPECRSRYQQAWQDARRPLTVPPATPCKSCGLPTTAKSGYCKRAKTCDAARARAEYTAEKGFRKHKPDEPRRRCSRCGRWLRLNLGDYVSLCRTCDNSTLAQRRRLLKAETMLAYGGTCACCGEEKLDFLSLDHISGDGAAERGGGRSGNAGSSFYSWLRASGFPGKNRYQVLCFNCNCAKGNGEECPCRKFPLSVYEVNAPGQLYLF
jgi:hypothetical protein